MPVHSRKRDVYRAVSIILGTATVLWLVSYCVATAIFEPVAQATPVGGAQAHATHAGLPSGAGSSGATDATRARLEALSERELKLLYARCSQDGTDRRLDGGEAIACSIAYDILLKAHFGGEFHDLLSWSRASGMPR